MRIGMRATMAAAAGLGLLAAAGAGIGAAAPLPDTQSGRPGVVTASGTLYGVAAASASNAWAVGYTVASGGTALIIRWNGTAWK